MRFWRDGPLGSDRQQLTTLGLAGAGIEFAGLRSADRQDAGRHMLAGWLN